MLISIESKLWKIQLNYFAETYFIKIIVYLHLQLFMVLNQ